MQGLLSRYARLPALAVGLMLGLFGLPGLVLGAGMLLAGATGVVMAQGAVEPLIIAAQEGPRRFEVEVMRTDEERARGLMFRRYLPADRGMLFDFKQAQPVMMWMKDTFIPLDMVFIRKDGTVSSIAENTEPHSTRTIASTEPVIAVLEINGGLAAKLGIKPGDKVDHAMFRSR